MRDLRTSQVDRSWRWLNLGAGVAVRVGAIDDALLRSGLLMTEV